jgi:hypothetical protein
MLWDLPPILQLIWFFVQVVTQIGGKVVNLGRRFGSGEQYELLLSIAALSAAILFEMKSNCDSAA